MADRHIEHVFKEMDAAFDAALAAEEESAADDLAMSLRQDVPLPALVGRGSWEVAVGDVGFFVVDEIGCDYVRAIDPSAEGGRVLVPSPLAVLRRCSTARGPAARTDRRLLTVLRHLVRVGGEIRVNTTIAAVDGRPEAATPTHLLLKGARTEWVIPLEQIRSVHLSGESLLRSRGG